MEMKVEGLEELEATLGKLNGRNVFQNYIRIGAETIRSKAGEYPSASSANSPLGGKSWYERGLGTKYRRNDGQITVYPTSENLGKKWRVSSSGGSNPQATIFNFASYAEYVHGEEQASFHGNRGWKQLYKVAEEELPKIVTKISNQIDKLLR